jgi:hypothetical protein
MRRSDIETSREILINAESGKPEKATCITSYNGKGALVHQEVGGVHSSVDGFVMKHGAKEPYLVDVNREVKEERWLENRY